MWAWLRIPFKLCHLMHMTLIVLNFIKERVPSEKRPQVYFKIFFEGCTMQFNLSNICVYICVVTTEQYMYMFGFSNP